MFFYSDISKGIEIDYSHLVKDINEAKNCPLYLRSTDYYVIFKTILLSLVHEKELCLLDADFSENEIKSLIGDVDIYTSVELPKNSFKNFSEIINKIQKSKNWRLSLFTSGTTGLPKKITHTFSSLTRNCKVSKKHTEDVWGYAYNPTHMAGIQVFFQAVLNENHLVRLFNLSRNEIFQAIGNYQISHLSATPTFLRLLFPADNIFNTIKRITSGGEKFDSKLSGGLKLLFPNAKLLNVYASTEAGSIFAAEGETFMISSPYLKFVKIENNELYLHRNILGKGTEKKLIGNWYPTGDLVKIIDENPIKFMFLSRKNEMINVGGYKVNPNEIEEVLLDIEGVLDSRVFGRPNSILGNIVCAEIVSDKVLEVAVIRLYLSKKLQEFKIPRIIKFVNSIEKTRTGKKKR